MYMKIPATLRKISLVFGLIGFTVFLAQANAQESAPAPAEGWPRLYDTNGDKLVVYQPQIQAWEKYAHMKAVAAIQVTPKGAKDGIFGILDVEAETETNLQTRMVVFQNTRITNIRFPNVETATAQNCSRIVRSAIVPKTAIPISLERVVAAMERSELQQRTVEVNLEPPPVFHSDKPAILVIFIGDPKFEPVKGTTLLFAVNTNWDIFLEVTTATYYLLNSESWLKTKDVLKGPWASAKRLPADLKKLPDDDNWQNVKKNVPGKPARQSLIVFVSTEPAELIVTDGSPSLSLIAGTSLLYITNTQSHLFLHSGQGNYYFLSAGRWFRAKTLSGPWAAASADLPADFAKIPASHAKGEVLASIPGTSDAEAAVLLASIPQKAKVNRKDTTVTVVYEGKPEFTVIKKAGVSYAVNTPNDVFLVDGRYYCCHHGVWFYSTKATGPWVVSTYVPQKIYSIPSTHPKYNVTYVYVYDSTPDTVVVGYTSGYSGAYVAATGALMFGLGYALGNDHDDYHHYHYHPHYYSYGCAARYDYYHGGFVRSGQYYGPYGGAGRAATYNPATGTYARGAYRYGPSGGAFAGQAYNPYTNRYAARAGATTPYGSWGRTVVADGDNWARAGQRSTWKGTVAGFETSQGAGAVTGRNRLTGSSATIGKNKYGDVYAGRDGNVYKRPESGGWQKYSGGSWNDIKRPEPVRSPGAARTGTSTIDRSKVGTANRSGLSNRTGRTSPGFGSASRQSLQGQLNRERSSRFTGSNRTQKFRQQSASRRSSSGRSIGGGRRGRR